MLKFMKYIWRGVSIAITRGKQTTKLEKAIYEFDLNAFPGYIWFSKDKDNFPCTYYLDVKGLESFNILFQARTFAVRNSSF